MTKKTKIVIGVSVGVFILISMLLSWLSGVRENNRQAIEILQRNGEENIQNIQNELDNLDKEMASRTYQPVFSFAGSGVKNSEPFVIRGERFKVKYDCTGDLCSANLEKIGSVFGGGLIMNNTGSAHDETIFYGSGEYYISSNSMGDFLMTVEDYR